ncbi:hypothetical protein EJB05_08363, partial [Eragrostis curvula]
MPLKGHAYLGWCLEIYLVAKNRPGAFRIAHENGLKRQFLQKQWGVSSSQPIEVAQRCTMGDRFLHFHST